ncbi:gliding motility-associated C-terminal domain-containing protein [Flavobacterium sp. 102]|uniref:T9SS type B sorting domain-containing protein n=1 Tax=Flavobacterium sp. 102 TaxID=2135623 RepID=UPI000EB3B9A7|nr:gliding motility-associated C-terminal domain-containing protein [Flavobacterium sp. 102]RKS01733.1 gliding motility-associated-like protein [Flavobacterium sp. 102]
MNGFKLKFSFVFLLITQLSFSQLSNFTLTVAGTNETCTANGKLTFNVSNTTVGSTILYTIYRLPDISTPISVQSTNTLTGLIAGSYRVIATQSLAGNSGMQQQDVDIEDLVVPLTYQVSSINETCGNDGRITVNVLSGTVATNGLIYELFSGPMIRPLQTSNVFNGLTAGEYLIRVFDNCGEGVVQTYNLQSSDTEIAFELFQPNLATCTTVEIGAAFQSVIPYPQGIVKFPLQIVTTLFPPSGPSITYTQNIANGIEFSQIVPLFANQNYSYTFTITDGCGTVYTLNGQIDNLSVEASYQVLPEDCTHQQITFFRVTDVVLVSAPSGFSTSLPQSYTSSIVNSAVTIGGLIAGTYVFNTVDICGNPEVFTIEVVITEVAPPFTFLYNVNCLTGSVIISGIQQMVLISAPSTYNVPLPHDYTALINDANYVTFENIPVGTYVFDVLDLCNQPDTVVVVIAPVSENPVLTVAEGCQDGFGTIRITGQFNSISMTSAPAAYGATLPLNLMGNLVSNGTTLTLDMLPAGNYVIQSVNLCNIPYTTNITILGHQDSTNVAVTPNCGSFNLNLNNTTNTDVSTSYWLQKLNTLTNDWGHPLTGVVYTNGTYPGNGDSVLLTNNSINYNLAYQGHFRILKVFQSFEMNNPDIVYCFKTLYEFDYNGLPQINDVYAVSCGGTFEVIVLAEGFDPLQYRITTRNGQPFVIENGNSNIFTGLQPATYNFQVEDACGNFLNSAFEILSPNPLAISANEINCDGENLTLSAPNFSFFQYEWWKDNNTTNILSTSSTLSFTPFNSVAHNGTYHVRITYTNNQSSCLNQVLSYTISVTNVPPNAGQGGSFSYCGRQGNIDLFALLQGNYDADGIWDEATSSGTLNNNIWDSSNVAFGSYEFRYHVDGSCNAFEEAFINITINEIPQVPTASADSIICEGGNLQLYATNVPNATYQWTGPNGFTSTTQNPIINTISPSNNGIYTVSAAQNSCSSESSSVAVLVNALPEFELSQNCIENEYVVTALPINNSFDPLTANYTWTGPNNFMAAQNPIVITRGEIGLYNLTVTDGNGCSVAQSIDVIRTICFIPNVITPNDDFTNDSFNLAGFEVDRIEIYNRWGRKVYEKNNYIDEWHGQNMKGERLPDSTYYYILSLRTGENKVGWVFVSNNQ